MSPALRLLGYQLSDVLRSRWLVGYALLLLVATDALLRLGGGSARALLGVTNVVLLVVPLVSVVLGTVQCYAAREFTELLLAQPVSRRSLFVAQLAGLALPLTAAVLVGAGVPFLVHGVDEPAHRAALAVLLGCGAALTWAFVAIAFLIAARTNDKARGLGAAVAVWLATGLLYDGLLLALVAALGDYPIERPLLALLAANPVDLARVLLLLQLDAAALMGYTGAVFARFFGSAAGALVAAGALALWIAGPAGLAARAFRKRDF
jgi:Cu-processing system permease protein